MDDIRDVIMDKVDALSPAEKRCARVLLADYPAAGLGSAASIADAAGTSTPTVLRFVSRMGFGTYREFQQRLREEVTRAATSPVQRASQKRAERASATNFSDAVDQRLALADNVLSTVPQAEFDAAVALLARRPRSTLVAGGYFTQYFASLLAAQLDQLIPGVEFTADPLTRDVGHYLDLRKGRVAILFDFRRYEQGATKLAGLVKESGASLIVFTDHELSPSAQLADVVLPVTVDGVPFDSDVGLLLVIESLVECVFNELGDKAIERMGRWEAKVQVPRHLTVHNRLPPGSRQP